MKNRRRGNQGVIFLTDHGLPEKAYGEMALESIAQIEKWGIQTHDIFQWLAILGEEVGELSKEVLEFWFGDGDDKDLEHIEKEAVQVATLALKIAWMVKEAREGGK